MKRTSESVSAAAGKQPDSRQRARQPSRERGQLRFQALLNATEALLTEHNPDDIGLYQIARRARIAPASVYHFFPTKNAALLALAEKYHVDIRAMVNAPVPAARLMSWQDLLIVRHERAVSYYNSHIPAAKIFLGIHPSWEIHQADTRYNQTASETLFGYYDRLFLMPYVQDPQEKFELIYAIADAIRSVSFERYGTITPKYAQESTAACIAYCRTFLPDRIDPRPAVLEAAARGDSVALLQ